VFAEDEVIPFRLVAMLWQATAGLGELRAAQVCRRLAKLALVSQGPEPAGGITLHDVIRDFLRAGLGEQRLAALNGMLLDAVAASLPVAGPLGGTEDRKASAAWWELGPQDRYLWDHLIEHLHDAGRLEAAEDVACDLRWVGIRLEQFGPAAPAADLPAVGTPRAARLRWVLGRTAHLLTPTDPAGAVIDVLHSRVAADPDWGPQVTALAGTCTCTRSRLVSLWPLPDLPDPALRRVLPGHASPVTVAAAADGSWLATAAEDGTVRVWDIATGRERALFKSPARSVAALAAGPDGTWLASGGKGGTVRVWDIATGRRRAVLKRPLSSIRAVAAAAAPDGTGLATVSRNGAVRVWDIATGRERALLKSPLGSWLAALAPDGTWLAIASKKGTVRVRDIATGHERGPPRKPPRHNSGGAHGRAGRHLARHRQQ
jgi:WD40 repeat protein